MSSILDEPHSPVVTRTAQEFREQLARVLLGGLSDEDVVYVTMSGSHTAADLRESLVRGEGIGMDWAQDVLSIARGMVRHAAHAKNPRSTKRKR